MKYDPPTPTPTTKRHSFPFDCDKQQPPCLECRETWMAAAGLTGQHKFREGPEENFPKSRGEAFCQRASKGLRNTHCSNMHLSFGSWPFISAAPDFVYVSGWNRLSLAILGLTVERDSQSRFPPTPTLFFLAFFHSQFCMRLWQLSGEAKS